MIVTRFAPSPTGFLHLGHAYAALTACDTATRQGGRFLLRIEDIDVTRCRPEFEAAIYDDLAWLGVRWDMPVRRQSEHFAVYAAALETLRGRDLLYPCFCTRKEIAAEIARAGVAPQASELGPDGAHYPGICRKLAPEVRSQRIAAGAPYALRLDTAKAIEQVGRILTFEELGGGPNGETGRQQAKPETLGDIVLARKELPTSYHLAVVVDDALQGVTRVTRGEDLFAATHIQRLLQSLLELPEPSYAHHRVIRDASGRKLSKRDFAVTLSSLRHAGATPESIRAMAAL